MPGREDFAIIRARLMADDRAHAAAAEFVKRGLSTEPLALQTVVGVIAGLGLWTSRETTDGVLPGNGLSAARAALVVSEEVAKVTFTALLRHGLLRRVRRGLYLVGFRDCYAPMIEKRKQDKDRKAKARAGKGGELSEGRPADVPRMSDGGPNAPDRRVPDLTGPDVPNGPADRTGPTAPGAPPDSAVSGVGKTSPDRPLTGAECAGLQRGIAACLEAKDVKPELRQRAKFARDAWHGGTLTPIEARKFIDLIQGWNPARIAYASGHKQFCEDERRAS